MEFCEAYNQESNCLGMHPQQYFTVKIKQLFYYISKTMFFSGMLNTGCSRIYDPILKLYKQQTGKDSTKAIIFSERS